MESRNDQSWFQRDRPVAAALARAALVRHTGATGGVLVDEFGAGHRLMPIHFDFMVVLSERHAEGGYQG